MQSYHVGRSVDVHPLAILLGLTARSMLASITGAIVASPTVATCAAVLRYLREDGSHTADEPGKEGQRRPASVAASAPRTRNDGRQRANIRHVADGLSCRPGSQGTFTRATTGAFDARA